MADRAPARRPDDGRAGLLLRRGETDPAWLAGGLLALGGLALLAASASVAVVLAAAFFAALLVAPVARRVERAVPDAMGWLGNLAALGALLAGLAALLGALAFCATRLVGAFRAVSADDLAVPLGGDESDGPSATLFDRLDVGLADLAARAADQASGAASVALAGAATTLSGVVLAIFLAMMMLVGAETWRRRLRTASPGRHMVWVDTFEALGVHVREFAAIRLAMGILTAILYGAWLWVMGVDLVWTWMVLTVVLALVPTLGSVVSGVLPTLYALLTRDLGTAALVGAGLLVIEQVMGNWIDPRIAGPRVNLSPLVVLVAVLFWGFLWGPAGALLATPMTLLAMHLGARVEPLRPLALMLSNRHDYDGLDDAAGIGAARSRAA